MANTRQATKHDIDAISRVRRSVHENKLSTTKLSHADYVTAIEVTGRGWVVEVNGEVVAFAIGNRESGNVWALFVHPEHQGSGYGRQLHDTMVTWLWSQGLKRLWLTTEPGSHAERFYEINGWKKNGHNEHGEIRFEMERTAQV